MAETVTEEKKGFFTKRRILVMAGVAALLVAVAVGVFVVLQGTSEPLVLHLSLGPSNTLAAPPATAPAVPATLVGQGVLIDLGSKVVNLADPGGYRYLRAGIVIECIPSDPTFYSLQGDEKADAEERERQAIAEKRAIIDDILIGLLSDCTFSEIFSYAGKEELKERLRAAINEQLGSQRVSRIYFTEFVIQ